MGNANALELHPDQESPTNPGCTSVISASLEDQEPPMTAEAFMDGLINQLRSPVDMIAERVLKSVDVTEHGSESFTVKVILDGKKLSSWGHGRGDDIDRVRAWKKVTVDRAQKLITTEDYVMDATLGAWLDEASDKEVLVTVHTKLLAEPTRLESWMLMGGQRMSGEELASGLQVWVNKVVTDYQSMANAQVKVAAGPSKKEPGHTSVLSSAIDEHVYYETYFSTMVKLTREELTKSPGAETDDVNSGEFVVSMMGEDGNPQSKWVVKHSEDTGDMSITIQNQQGQNTFCSFRKLHRDPVVLEAWTAGEDGQRAEPTSRFVMQIQKEVNGAITKATSWFG